MVNSPIAVLKESKLDFAKMVQTAPSSFFEPFLQKSKSNSDKEQYPVLLTLPGMKEFTDKIGFSDQAMKYFEVVNKKYYNGFAVDYDTMSDSKGVLGSTVETWVKGIVDDYPVYLQRKIQAELEANGTWVDGAAFFVATRANYLDTGDNVINNLATGTLSSAYTYATFSNDFQLAYNQMAAMKDKNNNPFNPDMSSITCIVPSHMKFIAEYVLGSNMGLVYSSGTISNQFAGQAKVVVNTFQSASNNDWYFVNDKSPFKPILVQEREAPKWNYEDDFESQLHKYSFTTRFAVKLLSPFGIVKVNN